MQYRLESKRDAYYITPTTPLVWDWSKFQALPGRYLYVRATHFHDIVPTQTYYYNPEKSSRYRGGVRCLLMGYAIRSHAHPRKRARKSHFEPQTVLDSGSPVDMQSALTYRCMLDTSTDGM